ncbi:MAG: hypothetical protein ACRDKV_05020, partial [Solirubrobacterales bacterium]
APRTLARTGSVSPRLLDAGDRLERWLLAACATSPELAELHGEDLARTVELQGVLTKIQDALQKVVAT